MTIKDIDFSNTDEKIKSNSNGRDTNIKNIDTYTPNSIKIN